MHSFLKSKNYFQPLTSIFSVTYSHIHILTFIFSVTIWWWNSIEARFLFLFSPLRIVQYSLFGLDTIKNQLFSKQFKISFALMISFQMILWKHYPFEKLTYLLFSFSSYKNTFSIDLNNVKNHYLISESFRTKYQLYYYYEIKIDLDDDWCPLKWVKLIICR